LLECGHSVLQRSFCPGSVDIIVTSSKSHGCRLPNQATNHLYANYIWIFAYHHSVPHSSPSITFFLLQFLIIYLQSFYYFAIVEDLILRFAWAYSYVFIKANYVSEDLMTSINSPLEVFRYVINYLLLICVRCIG
jgi:hypothetical protein